MDRKTILILVIALLLLVLWNPLVDKMFPPPKVAPRPATSTNALGQTVVPINRTAPSLTPGSPARAAAVRPVEESTLDFETPQARYTFTSAGGGIQRVELKEYPLDPGCKEGSTNRVYLNQKSALPILALMGGEEVAGDNVFTLSKIANGIRAEKTLESGLQITKDFIPTSNYMVQVTVSVANPSSDDITWPAQEWSLGSVKSVHKKDDALALGMLWYDGESSEFISQQWFENRTLGCFKGNPRALYQGGANNVLWASMQNQFFAVALAPGTNAPANRVVGRAVTLGSETISAEFSGSLVYPESVIKGRFALKRDFHIYAGPKEYNVLARHGAQLGNQLEHIMNFGKFFGFFAKILLLTMNQFHSWGLNYGLAIVAMTILIKLVFWPLTNASTKSMKRMAALQPQMQAIQQKYKDDPEKKNRKVMEFMKENKMNPLGGCLPLLLQMPVFFGLIAMLRSAIELRGAKFLWVCDLSQPDTVLNIAGLPLNPLWFIMLATMVWQMRLTPPSPGMDPTQQKIMKWMPVAFMAFFYGFASGLTLYWAVQNLLSILQTKVTKTFDTPTGAAPASLAAPKGKA